MHLLYKTIALYYYQSWNYIFSVSILMKKEKHCQ